MEKFHLKKATIKEGEFKKVYNCTIYPINSRRTSDERFVKIDNGEQSGTQWTCFISKKTNYSTLTRLEDNVINF